MRIERRSKLRVGPQRGTAASHRVTRIPYECLSVVVLRLAMRAGRDDHRARTACRPSRPSSRRILVPADLRSEKPPPMLPWPGRTYAGHYHHLCEVPCALREGEGVSGRGREGVCVCVCEREREKERERVHII